MTPPALDRVVKKCLAKELEKRWQAASDVCDELKWIVEGGSQAGIPAGPAGEVIDFSRAGPYYRALGVWGLRRVRQELTSLGSYNYRASSEFFDAFLKRLSEVKKHRTPGTNDADLVALALFRASALFRRPEKPISCFREMLRSSPKGLAQIIGPAPIRKGVFDFVSTKGSHKLSLRFACGLEGGDEPWVALEIQGEPARAFAMALYDAYETGTRKDARQAVKRFWSFVLEMLYVLTGTKNAKGGRPTERHVSEAHFLRHICGLGWSAIARELCQSQNCDHGARCQERFRKAVEQYRRRTTMKSAGKAILGPLSTELP
jgi:hypothetical protein